MAKIQVIYGNPHFNCPQCCFPSHPVDACLLSSYPTKPDLTFLPSYPSHSRYRNLPDHNPFPYKEHIHPNRSRPSDARQREKYNCHQWSLPPRIPSQPSVPDANGFIQVQPRRQCRSPNTSLHLATSSSIWTPKAPHEPRQTLYIIDIPSTQLKTILHPNHQKETLVKENR